MAPGRGLRKLMVIEKGLIVNIRVTVCGMLLAWRLQVNGMTPHHKQEQRRRTMYYVLCIGHPLPIFGEKKVGLYYETEKLIHGFESIDSARKYCETCTGYFSVSVLQDVI